MTTDQDDDDDHDDHEDADDFDDDEVFHHTCLAGCFKIACLVFWYFGYHRGDQYCVLHCTMLSRKRLSSEEICWSCNLKKARPLKIRKVKVSYLFCCCSV